MQALFLPAYAGVSPGKLTIRKGADRLAGGWALPSANFSAFRRAPSRQQKDLLTAAMADLVRRYVAVAMPSCVEMNS